jgi:hypothetical protein
MAAAIEKEEESGSREEKEGGPHPERKLHSFHPENAVWEFSGLRKSGGIH